MGLGLTQESLETGRPATPTKLRVTIGIDVNQRCNCYRCYQTVIPTGRGGFRSECPIRSAEHGTLIGVEDQTSTRTWLTVPDLVELLGVNVGRVRRLIEDKYLLAVRVDGVLRVPADFISGSEPLSELRGTLFVLSDAGFDDEEAMNWLLESEESLGTAPIDALRAGRKAEVRRVAQALG